MSQVEAKSTEKTSDVLVVVWIGSLDATTTAQLLSLYQEWQRLTADQVSKKQVFLFLQTSPWQG